MLATATNTQPPLSKGYSIISVTIISVTKTLHSDRHGVRTWYTRAAEADDRNAMRELKILDQRATAREETARQPGLVYGS